MVRLIAKRPNRIFISKAIFPPISEWACHTDCNERYSWGFEINLRRRQSLRLACREVLLCIRRFPNQRHAGFCGAAAKHRPGLPRSPIMQRARNSCDGSRCRYRAVRRLLPRAGRRGPGYVRHEPHTGNWHREPAGYSRARPGGRDAEPGDQAPRILLSSRSGQPCHVHHRWNDRQ